MKQISIAAIGLGCRGYALLWDILTKMPQYRIDSVCDVYPDRIERAAGIVEKNCGYRPFGTTDYHELLGRSSVDLCMIFTSWTSHTGLAVEAMEAGKAVAMEVGGAHTLEECQKLVGTWEKTRMPFFFLENCCFGKRETMVLHMVRRGLFGEIVHCRGGYRHDLRTEIAYGRENRHYRLEEYKKYNRENYPTHELGPIAKVLDLGRGNRIVSLASFASKAAGMEAFIRDRKPDDETLRGVHFAQGDIVTTILRCEDGQTVQMTLDTTLPRSYSRDFSVYGTLGMYSEESDSIFIDKVSKEYWSAAPTWGNAKEYEDYLVPHWKDVARGVTEVGHGGMDWFEMEVLADCLLKGNPSPLDVYDAAMMMAVSPLSEKSIREGGAVQAFPDFTGGAWKTRPVLDVLPLE